MFNMVELGELAISNISLRVLTSAEHDCGRVICMPPAVLSISSGLTTAPYSS
jgi:hypothetical protein